jgi:hypothetical protein
VHSLRLTLPRKFLEKKDLSRRFDGDLLHVSDSADRLFSGVALGNQVNRQHGPGPAKAGFTMHSNRSVGLPLLLNETDEFARLSQTWGTAI